MSRYAAPLAALFSLALLAGCPSFHADDSSELRCDAAGCQLCNQYACYEYFCDASNQCPAGYHCKASANGSHCVPGSTAGPGGLGSFVCKTSDDCPAGYACNAAGSCVDTATTPDPPAETPVDGCKLNADCAPGSECVEGACKAKAFPVREGTCELNYDCGANGVCVNQGCYFPPAGGACPMGGAEYSGLCLPSQPGAGECVLGADCGAGGFCIDTTCHFQCKAADDCGHGSVCGTVGLCVLDTKPLLQCLATADCAKGTCVDGRCLASCNMAAESPCGESMSCYAGFCKQESDCVAAGDCHTGDACIDGKCGELGIDVVTPDVPADEPPADDPPADDPPADDPPEEDPPSDDPPSDDPPEDDPPPDEEHTD